MPKTGLDKIGFCLTCHEWQGVVYYSLQEYEKAVDIFSQVIELEPDFFMAYIERGVTYQELEQWQEAKTDFEKANALTDDPQIKKLLGELMMNLGDS
jgi:tetratricopeptide (TPR) repeat protein